MTTARAVLLSAVLIVFAIAGAAWWTTSKVTQAERFQIVNVGDGATVRLDRQTGDLIACRFEQCRQLAKGEKLEAASEGAAIPPPPAGAVVDTVPPPPEGYTRDN